MFLKIFVAFSIILLSIASEFSGSLEKTDNKNTFHVKVFGKPSWDDSVISSVNATLVKKNVTKVLAGIKNVENKETLLLTYLENNNQTKDYLTVLQYTTNGIYWNMRFFNIPDDCTNLVENERNYVNMYNGTDYDCDLGDIKLT